MNLLPKTCFLLAVLFLSSKSNADDVVAEPLWRYISPTGACEIAAYSVDTQRVFVTT